MKWLSVQISLFPGRDIRYWKRQLEEDLTGHFLHQNGSCDFSTAPPTMEVRDTGYGCRTETEI